MGAKKFIVVFCVHGSRCRRSVGRARGRLVQLAAEDLGGLGRGGSQYFLATDVTKKTLEFFLIFSFFFWFFCIGDISGHAPSFRSQLLHKHSALRPPTLHELLFERAPYSGVVSGL